MECTGPDRRPAAGRRLNHHPEGDVSKEKSTSGPDRAEHDAPAAPGRRRNGEHRRHAVFGLGRPQTPLLARRPRRSGLPRACRRCHRHADAGLYRDGDDLHRPARKPWLPGGWWHPAEFGCARGRLGGGDPVVEHNGRKGRRPARRRALCGAGTGCADPHRPAEGIPDACCDRRGTVGSSLAGTGGQAQRGGRDPRRSRGGAARQYLRHRDNRAEHRQAARRGNREHLHG